MIKIGTHMIQTPNQIYPNFYHIPTKVCFHYYPLRLQSSMYNNEVVSWFQEKHGLHVHKKKNECKGT